MLMKKDRADQRILEVFRHIVPNQYLSKTEIN